MTRAAGSLKDTKRADELLDVATRVFYENGYAGTSVQTLADAMGILKGSIYHHLKSKEDLLFQIVKTIHDEGPVRVAAIDNLAAGPEQKFCLFTYVGVDYTLANRERIAIFLSEYRYLGAAHKNRLSKRRYIYSTYLKSLIADGMDSGVFHNDLDPEHCARAIIGALNALCYTRGKVDTHKLALHYTAQMARSLLTKAITPDHLYRDYVEPHLAGYHAHYEKEFCRQEAIGHA